MQNKSKRINPENKMQVIDANKLSIFLYISKCACSHICVRFYECRKLELC
jgi:hypothetical protein